MGWKKEQKKGRNQEGKTRREKEVKKGERKREKK